MTMFEQDFLCTLNGDTNLTNSDVHSGAEWMRHMDSAAAATNTTLQCVPQPCLAMLPDGAAARAARFKSGI